MANFIDPRFKNDAVWVPREIQMSEDGFIHSCSRFKLSGGATCNAVVLSHPSTQASSRRFLRPRPEDDYDSADDVKLVEGVRQAEVTFS